MKGVPNPPILFKGNTMQVINENFMIDQHTLCSILNDKGQLKVLKFLLNNLTHSYMFDNYTTLAKRIGFKTKSGVWKALQKLKDNNIIDIINDKFYRRKIILLKNRMCIYNDYE